MDEAAKTFDIVAANLWFPVRIRGFDHDREAMLALCRGFLRGLPAVLKPEGVALLASADFADGAALRRLFVAEGVGFECSVMPRTYDGGRIRVNWCRYRLKPRALAQTAILMTS